LARYEGDIRPADGEALELDELLALLERNALVQQPARDNARACYLSSSEGWREAVKHLGGAFAEELKSLKESKAE